MNRLQVLRFGVWCVPLVFTYAVVIASQRSRRTMAALLVGIVWNAWSVLAVNLVAAHLDWWSYHPGLPTLIGVPLEPWFGWVLLWGAVVPLITRDHPVLLPVLAVVWLDLIVMPGLDPLVVLNEGWLIGEALALLFGFLPGLLFFRWTLRGQHLTGRVFLQIACFGALLLWLVPTAALETHGGWATLLELEVWQIGLMLQSLLLPVTLALRAVNEFAVRGGGTPIPYDPPKRLVTSGPYSYVRNPMQLSVVLIYLVSGIALGNVWLFTAAFVSFAYGAGLAEWHEHVQLSQRFDNAWGSYRASVRPWLPRWRPAITERSTLLVAYSCGTCSSVGRWFLARAPIGLVIAPAEESRDPDLRRVTYVPADGRAQRGVIAVARALEHIHLGWAIVGWVLALPLVSHFAQLVVDVFGPSPGAVAGRPYDPAACAIELPEQAGVVTSAKAR